MIHKKKDQEKQKERKNNGRRTEKQVPKRENKQNKAYAYTRH